MRKPLAVIATLLAGTHMAASVMPETKDDNPSLVIPIQYYGYGYSRPYYEPYRYGPGGYYEPNYGNRYYGGRMMDPEAMPTMRRWRWESGQGRYNNPPWMGRGW